MRISKSAYDTDPVAHEVLTFAIAVEGLARSAGTHAAGVVIADVPLDTVLPLQTITGKEDIITQWDGPTVEKVGPAEDGLSGSAKSDDS